jgi:hypothetical protein
MYVQHWVSSLNVRHSRPWEHESAIPKKLRITFDFVKSEERFAGLIGDTSMAGYGNYYRCPSDGTEWADSSMSNDRCPSVMPRSNHAEAMISGPL